ncbi:MAG: DNA mismatch repair endonuclease MutL [Smithellaceae bacterium]
MSSRIVVLSEEIANKIAAGEVVERPASIVKELVENAIDAGADDIRVELEKGGCASIAIIDNGSGIEYEDVALAFERHATSKIHQFEDIYRVASFGFRGEAIPSIASIARVELLTRRSEDLAGTKAVVERGIIKEITPAGCSAGTQIRVTKIFENVPARRKFLKTESTEQGLCLDAITRLALAHPEIRFKVLANSREIFTAPEAKDISERIAFVMGSDFSSHCLSVDGEKENVKLSGFISRPEFTRSNSKNIFLFVNKRFVRDNNVSHAVLSAYRQIIEARRYPAAVLFLDLPGDDVDVNVHPAKVEVRFKDSRNIHDLVSRTIAQSLASAETAKGSFVYRLSPREKTSPSDFRRPAENFPSGLAGLYSRQNLQQAISSDLLFRSQVESGVVKEASVTAGYSRPKEQIAFTDFNYLGQVARTYLVFAGDSGFILIDQHAAHERIVFEKLKQSSDRKIIGQPLLLPEVVSLSPGQISLFAGYIEFLQEIGLEVEIFGRDAVVVKALPAILPQMQAREIIADIADQMADQNQLPDLQERKEKILASLACRAAIKANSLLAEEEVSALCRDLEATPNNATCPHGRPIVVNFSLSEIERMFKRK